MRLVFVNNCVRRSGGHHGVDVKDGKIRIREMNFEWYRLAKASVHRNRTF